MPRIDINTGESSYAALIERGSLATAGERLREVVPDARQVVVVTVNRVRKLHAKRLVESLERAKFETSVIEMSDGERYKNVATVAELAEKLSKIGADRKSVIVVLGGGVVGDVGAFLASIYMRGISAVQIPTTFLAQVDSSVGGKTGVDIKAGKNLLGTFHQPKLVVIDPEVLLTLPERDFRAGLFESLKAGVIYDAKIFNFMEEHRDTILARNLDSLEWLITESVKVKADVVSQDPHEAGLRRILNFGHTIGHALEADTDYKHFLHGEAVAWGMIAATMIAVGMQKTSSNTAQRIISNILAYAPLPAVTSKSKDIFRRLSQDKKTIHGKTHLILPIEIGRVEVTNDVPERAILQSIEELRMMSHLS